MLLRADTILYTTLPHPSVSYPFFQLLTSILFFPSIFYKLVTFIFVNCAFFSLQCPMYSCEWYLLPIIALVYLPLGNFTLTSKNWLLTGRKVTNWSSKESSHLHQNPVLDNMVLSIWLNINMAVTQGQPLFPLLTTWADYSFLKSRLVFHMFYTFYSDIF